jgi:PqqD family protein of HPr-rel-A system
MAGPTFTVDPEENYRSVDLGGLTALFHLRSGMTHILAPPAPQILEILAEGPADIAEILLRLQDRFDLDPQEDMAGAVEARLAELEAAGLAARA